MQVSLCLALFPFVSLCFAAFRDVSLCFRCAARRRSKQTRCHATPQHTNEMPRDAATKKRDGNTTKKQIRNKKKQKKTKGLQRRSTQTRCRATPQRRNEIETEQKNKLETKKNKKNKRSAVAHVNSHQRSLPTTQAHYPTTEDTAGFCLLCCQPEPMPLSLSTRTSQLTPRCPCGVPTWSGRAINAARRT